MELVTLSPHLDDAVFSCGGRIAANTARGGRALIVTLFTGDPDPAVVQETHATFANFEVRKAEDARAAAVLRAEVRWLGLVERAYRPPRLRRFSDAFRSPSAAPGAFEDVESLEQVIVGLLHEFPEAEVVAPLAVGNHVDHVAVFVAAIRVLVSEPAGRRLSFYEDAYALGARIRRQHFVTRQRPWRRGEAPERLSLRTRALFTMLSLMRRGPPVERHLPAAARKLLWRSELQVLERFESAKLAAALEYRSQVELLGGPGTWTALLRRYHRSWGGEPIWRAEPVTEGQAQEASAVAARPKEVG